MFEHLKDKKLYRSPKDALLLGVCAGLAKYLRIDVIFVRLVFIGLTVLSGWWPMPLIYIIAAVLVPVDPAQTTVARTQQPKDITSDVEHMDRNQNA
jgi:phage shock protein C